MSNRFLLILTLCLTAWSSANAGQFEAVYTDNINNLSWSKALPGTYSNGCTNANGEYDASKCTFEIGDDGTRQVKAEDSNAAKACQKIGARLPTKREYDSLVQNFPHTVKPCWWNAAKTCSLLTQEGIADMQSVFGDMNMNSRFWSSSLSTNDLYNAFVFNGGSLGYVVNYVGRNNFYLVVRCVAGR